MGTVASLFFSCVALFVVAVAAIVSAPTIGVLCTVGIIALWGVACIAIVCYPDNSPIPRKYIARRKRKRIDESAAPVYDSVRKRAPNTLSITDKKSENLNDKESEKSSNTKSHSKVTSSISDSTNRSNLSSENFTDRSDESTDNFHQKYTKIEKKISEVEMRTGLRSRAHRGCFDESEQRLENLNEYIPITTSYSESLGNQDGYFDESEPRVHNLNGDNLVSNSQSLGNTDRVNNFEASSISDSTNRSNLSSENFTDGSYEEVQMPAGLRSPSGYFDESEPRVHNLNGDILVSNSQSLGNPDRVNNFEASSISDSTNRSNLSSENSTGGSDEKSTDNFAQSAVPVSDDLDDNIRKGASSKYIV